MPQTNTAKQSKAKQSKRGLDEGTGRSLYALQITYNIICTNCTLLIKIINETSTSYSG